MRKAIWIIVALILFLIISLLTYSYYPRPAENEVNVCLHLSDYGCSTISYLTELGVKWVRTDWLVTDDNSMSDYSQKLQDNNINLLTIVNMSKFGNQINLEEWNETVVDIVNSEGFNNAYAVEVFNEPNNYAYFIPAETYYEMLKSVYTIIKNYTQIPVFFAGVSPDIADWQTYLNEVFSYEDVQEYFDYMGIHFYYDDIETNLDVLHFVKGLTSKPIWLTETGKPSTENYDETWQAEYLSSIYSTFKPLVGKIFIYELKDNPAHSNDPEGHFGLLTVEGAQKEAYWVVCYINRK